ncbi:MAG: 4-hydroxybutyrate CoA-transferase [Solirubrobacteraceae bacterium]|nr:4-hydroxybutyrate CoA-transferase [Solirubrobacteraceae bacterium]
MALQGQAASESAGHRHISGTGGQAQFVRGAYASVGGKSFICMPSTYERHGVRASRIVVDLTSGNVGAWTGAAGQYSFLITKYEPRIVPASFDFCRANLKRDSSSGGMSIPSDSLKPTARFSGPSTVYITFTDRPLS